MQTDSQSSSPTDEPDSIKQLKFLLRSTLRISVSDGRIFIGTFVGTDKALNLLLVNTDEFRLGPRENPGGRYVGQIMVPWRLVVRVEMDGVDDDVPGIGDGVYM